ncbi:MAG: hypothetical protein NC083_08835 [Muribaculum sp.]|nr:hypothetical protein [Muribaculum sp.]
MYKYQHYHTNERLHQRPAKGCRRERRQKQQKQAATLWDDAVCNYSSLGKYV